MLRKHTAAIAMCLAYAIMLLHSIVPHHHHDQKQTFHLPGEIYHLEHHEHDNHHGDNPESDNDLSHLLSHLVPHAEDAFTFIAAGKLHANGFKPGFEYSALLPDNFFISLSETPPLCHFQPPEKFLYLSPGILFTALRAPPFLTA